MMNKFRINLLLVIILLVGFATHFVRLGENPPFMRNDELEYVNNGYSIYKTGKDLYGDFLPVSVGGVGYVAIPAYLVGFSVAFFGLNEQSVRLLPVIFITLEVLLIYGISKILFKSEKIALSAAFIFALSTWSLKMSRLMSDSPTALFFYLLGIFLFLKADNVRLITISLITLCLGTLSYYRSLFIFPPVLLALIIYRWDFLKKFRKQFLISSLIILLITGFVLALMLFKLGQNSGSLMRAQELIFFNTKHSKEITDHVIHDRHHNKGPEILNKIIINKITYLGGGFFPNYFGAFSPRMIFAGGDISRNFSRNFGLWDRRDLSILDFPLVMLGAYYLLKKSKKGGFLVISLILIAPLTSALESPVDATPVYATRAFLMWPFLIILAGSGLAWMWEWGTSESIIKVNWKKITLTVFLTLYIFFLFSHLYQYFLSFVNFAEEAFIDSEKQLAFYLIEHKEEKMTVYYPRGRLAFMKYFFYSKMDPKVAQKVLSRDNIKADILIDSIRFVNDCFNPTQDTIDHKVIVSTDCIPQNLELAYAILRARDSNWAIFLP